MGSKHMGADVNVAWPTAQIAVMGASGAVGFVYRSQLAEAAKNGDDVDALRLQLQAEYEDTLVNPTSPPSADTSTRSSRRRTPAATSLRRCACSIARSCGSHRRSTETFRCDQ